MNPITTRPLTVAEQASRIASVVAEVPCTRHTAATYLDAHHWNVWAAVESWRRDHLSLTHEPGFVALPSLEACD